MTTFSTNNTTLRLTACASMMMLALAATPAGAAGARFHRANAAGGETASAPCSNASGQVVACPR